MASNENVKPGSPMLVSLPQFVSSSVTLTVVFTEDVRRHTSVLYEVVGAKSISTFWTDPGIPCGMFTYF
jgi:hypothetical protein